MWEHLVGSRHTCPGRMEQSPLLAAILSSTGPMPAHTPTLPPAPRLPVTWMAVTQLHGEGPGLLLWGADSHDLTVEAPGRGKRRGGGQGPIRGQITSADGPEPRGVTRAHFTF